MENKRLLSDEELNSEYSVKVIEPNLYKILEDICKDNINIDLIDFNKLSRDFLFQPVELFHNEKLYEIQANFCADPFCKWYGLGKSNLNEDNITKLKKNIYVTGDFNNKVTNCNHDKEDFNRGVVTSSHTTTISNYSLALEIKRLLDIKTLASEKNMSHLFHEDWCPFKDSTPFTDKKQFRYKGRTKQKSKRWICHKCGKDKTISPELEENFTLGLQNSEKMIPLFKMLMNRSPIRGASNVLGITGDTIYRYIEDIYIRCLMFLEKHESEFLRKQNLGELYLSTDQLIYYNNNYSNKYSGFDTKVKERNHIQTRIISTVDNRSYYVFASDVAYDFNTSATDVLNDYIKFNEEFLTYNVQKNARFNLSSYVLDKVNKQYENLVKDDEVESKLSFDPKYELNRRMIYQILGYRQNYIKGMHVNSTYTCYAQYFILKNSLKYDKIFFVSDKDKGIATTLSRVFVDDIKEGKVHLLNISKPKNFNFSENAINRK